MSQYLVVFPVTQLLTKIHKSIIQSNRAFTYVLSIFQFLYLSFSFKAKRLSTAQPQQQQVAMVIDESHRGDCKTSRKRDDTNIFKEQIPSTPSRYIIFPSYFELLEVYFLMVFSNFLVALLSAVAVSTTAFILLYSYSYFCSKYGFQEENRV